MKVTGLMFKAPLVRAILSGQKTQTRRLVKWKDLQKGLNLGFSGLRATETASGWVLESNSRSSNEWRCKPTPCPQGQPGDRIYVRETWAHGIHAMAAARDEDGPFVYAAEGSQAEQGRLGDRWKPSIHMPKTAARIWLEVTGVRVERLQSISEADAVRDGGLYRLPATGRYVINQGDQYFGMATHDPRELFQEIWESTGGDWAANPWVWVIDFKTISTTGRPA